MPRADLNRQKVILAAVEILNQRGIEGLTMLSLASRLKVKSPSLYNHIDGWDDLLRGVAIHGLHALAKEMTQAVLGKSGEPALRSAAESFRGFVRRNPTLYAMTLQAPSKKDREWTEASDSILRILVACLADYRLAKDELIHVLRAFRSAIHGFASLESARGFGLPQEVDQSFNYLLDSLIHGIVRSSSPLTAG